MPGKILGIDISDRNISATQVISGLKGYQLVSCFSTPVVDGNFEKALEELSQSIDLENDRCFLSVPHSVSSFRNINTPFKESKKIRQTLSFEIETHVPFPVDDMIIDYSHTDASNRTSILTASVNKTHIAGYIQKLGSLGLDPDIIDIRPVPAVQWVAEQENAENGLYIDLEPDHQCIVLFKNKHIILVRELSFSIEEIPKDTELENGSGFSPESIDKLIDRICIETGRTIHSFNSQPDKDFSVEKIFYGGSLSGYSDIANALNSHFKVAAEKLNIIRDSKISKDPDISRSYEPALMDNSLAAAVRENRKAIGFNLRRGEFTVKKKLLSFGKELKTIFILLGVLFALMIFNTGTDYYFLSKRHAAVEEQFNNEFDNILPLHKGTKDSRYRLMIVDQEYDKMKNPSQKSSGDGLNPDRATVLEILKEIHKRIPSTYEYDINTVVIGDDITIQGTTDSLETGNRIVNSLKPSEMFRDVKTVDNRQTKEGRTLNIKLERAK